MWLTDLRARLALTLPRVTMLLLLGAGVATSVVVYQAYQAQRSHEETVARALTEYGAFALWQFGELLPNAMFSALGSAYQPVISGVGPENPAPPSLEEFARAAIRPGVRCRCMGGIVAAFRFDVRNDVFEVQGQVPEGLDRWVRDTLRAHRADLTMSRLRFGLPLERRRAVPGAVEVVHGVLLSPPPRAELALAFAAIRDASGAPILVFGLVSPPAPLLTPILARVLTHGSVLPPSLTRGARSETLLSLRVRTPRGRELFTRGPQVDSGRRHAVVDTVEATMGSLVVSATLTPEAAARLILGGPPRARLPLLVAFLLLAVGLVGVALAQLRRQQRFMRARAAFITGVSHELRTPLAQIRLLAEMLQTERLESPAARQRSLRIIDQEARRLSFLVDNVLTFTRAERDLFRITPVPLGLEREVSDAVALFAPLAQKAQVRFDVAVPAGVQVMMDQAAFRQVLVNLLDNAVRYGPPGQRVRIAASAFDADRAFVELVVTDEGPGVPAEAVERVLEPYVRLDREQERAAGGTGLGLAIVRDIMRRHGGAVSVTPTAPTDRGARIVLRLPRAESARPGEIAVVPIEAARGA